MGGAPRGLLGYIHPSMTDETARTGAHPRLVLLVVGLGTFMSAASGSTVNLALPQLGSDLGVSIDSAGWVVSSYLLSITVLLLVAGRLGDLVGLKLVYLAGFSLFGVASVACGLSPSLHVLIASRLLQGVGASFIMATGPALLTTTFPGKQRGRALGMLATATYSGLTVGPLAGGWVLDALTWPWIFYINVPAAVVVVALGLRFLPRGERRTDQPFDLLGSLTVLSGLPLLLIAVSRGVDWGWTSPATLGCAVGGIALLGAFVWQQTRAESPMLDLSLFKSKVFSGAVLSALGNYVALFVAIILLPYYLTEARGSDSLHAGIILSAQPLVMAIVASPAGRLSDRIGSRGLATSGMLVLAVGMGGLAFVDGQTPLWLVATWLGVVGLGTGIFISPNSSSLMGSAPRNKQGVAGGVMAVARNLGMMIGVSSATTLFRMAGGETGGTWETADFTALHVAMAFGAVVGVLSALAAALRGR